MRDDNILEMRNIHKSFGGLRALIDVNLDLRRGEILGLVGDNAAGKSTLMKIMSGAYHADEGRIFFAGTEVSITNPRVAKQLGIEMVYHRFRCGTFETHVDVVGKPPCRMAVQSSAIHRLLYSHDESVSKIDQPRCFFPHNRFGKRHGLGHAHDTRDIMCRGP